MRSIGRDPFARIDLVRQVEEARQPCAWCGNWRNKAGRRLFRYGEWQDGIHTRPVMDQRLFCSKSCRNNFYT